MNGANMNLVTSSLKSDTLDPRPLEGRLISQSGANKIPEWVTKLAWLMDNSIPIGKRWSIGLDGIVGLFPGVGDLAGGFVSALIVASAAQAGLPRAALGRMMANVAVDTLLGSIPFVGDVFDFAFKANTRNIRIYQEHLAGRRQRRRDWLFTLLVVLALLAIVAIPIVVFVCIVRRLMM